MHNEIWTLLNIKTLYDLFMGFISGALDIYQYSTAFILHKSWHDMSSKWLNCITSGNWSSLIGASFGAMVFSILMYKIVMRAIQLINPLN